MVCMPLFRVHTSLQIFSCNLLLVYGLPLRFGSGNAFHSPRCHFLTFAGCTVDLVEHPLMERAIKTIKAVFEQAIAKLRRSA